MNKELRKGFSPLMFLINVIFLKGTPRLNVGISSDFNRIIFNSHSEQYSKISLSLLDVKNFQQFFLQFFC